MVLCVYWSNNWPRNVKDLRHVSIRVRLQLWHCQINATVDGSVIASLAGGVGSYKISF